MKCPPCQARRACPPSVQLPSAAHNDACQLACLAVELRLAALVDTACSRPTAAQLAAEVLAGLYAQLHEAAPLVAKRLAQQGWAEAQAETDGDCAYLAWLLDALQCAVAYFASTRVQPVRG